jgi:hypothetical protein
MSLNSFGYISNRVREPLKGYNAGKIFWVMNRE